MIWQPIETAPRDGCFVLVYVAEPFSDSTQQICVSVWDSDLDGWMTDLPAGGWDFVDPTHWMPLPEPPK